MTHKPESEKAREWWIADRAFERDEQGLERSIAFNWPTPAGRGIHVIEKSAYDKAIEALRFYANKGKPTSAHPYNEFGCGCCASSVNAEGNNDYEEYGEEVQGKLARETLRQLGCLNE